MGLEPLTQPLSNPQATGVAKWHIFKQRYHWEQSCCEGFHGNHIIASGKAKNVICASQNRLFSQATSSLHGTKDLYPHTSLSPFLSWQYKCDIMRSNKPPGLGEYQGLPITVHCLIGLPSFSLSVWPNSLRNTINSDHDTVSFLLLGFSAESVPQEISR